MSDDAGSSLSFKCARTSTLAGRTPPKNRSTAEVAPRHEGCIWIDLATTCSRPQSSRRMGLAYPFKVHRLTGAVEATLAMATAAGLQAAGVADAEGWLLIGFLINSAMMVIAHAVSIFSSRRLDP